MIDVVLMLQAFFLYVLFLFAPGFIVSLRLGVDRYLITYSFGISYVFLILIYLFSKFLSLSPEGFLILWLIGAVLLFVLSYKQIRWTIQSQYIVDYNIILIIALWTIYALIAGPPDVVPADFIQHFSQIKHLLIQLEYWDKLDFVLDWYLAKGNFYGYLFPAIQAWILDVRPYELIWIWSWLNALILLLVMFEFGRFIFKPLSKDSKTISTLSFVSVLLVPFMFGVNEFSYVRVYFNAVAIYNYALFLFVSLVFMRFIDGKHTVLVMMMLVISSMVTLLITHPQELMFFLVMLSLVSMVSSLKLYLLSNNKLIWVRNYVSIISVLSVIVSAYLIFYVLVNPTPSPPNGIRVLSLPFTQGMSIVSMGELQRIIGIIGGSVLIISIFYWKEWYKSTWLIASILSLVVTVFNPFFVDLFWRFSPTADSMYRFIFLSQSYWFMSILLWIGYRRFFSDNREIIKIIPILLVASIFIMTMVGFKGFGPNRIHGLEPVPESQSARHWSDLWKYMDTLPEFPTVLTDPLTGYMVRGFTKQNFNGHRFRKDNTFIEYNFDNYQNNPLQQHAGKYLIINLRDGNESKIGKLTGHWPKEELTISRYYSKALIDHINNTNMFELKWKSVDGLITVYMIHNNS
jgi:hypothetical protein